LKPLRIGCVKYLNARPLIHGWPDEFVLDHPAALCGQLARGDLDVALVSSFEFLRNPIYRIVDDISISSDGPVYSVVVARRDDVSQIEEIELDPAAETSVALLHCLLRECGLNPRLLPRSRLEKRGEGVPGSAGCEPAVVGSLPTTSHARLLIGDQAIRFRQEHMSVFGFWDLGEQWKRLVGLPFVYALWLVRPEVNDAKTVARRLRVLRDQNLASIDKLIAREKDFDPEFCGRYYREHLRFNFGANEKKGLRAFESLCEKHGLLPKRDIKVEVV
jgi:chorismate dehydratase